MSETSGGQGHCANCSAPLADRYCGRCGQDSHVSLSFGHFLHEFVEGLFHVDSSFWRTLRLLVTRPGLLTEQYLGGKRRAYSPPFRSYLVISIAYFVVASVFGAQDSQVLSRNGRAMQPSDCTEMAANAGWLLKLVPDLEGSCMRALSDDRRAMTSRVEHLLPKVMFVVLPLVALVAFWVYRRQRPLYLENLIFVLHFQSFYYLISIVALLIAAGIAALTGAKSVGQILDLAVYVWTFVYLFIATRRVYRASIFKTSLGLLVVTLSYIVFWAAGLAVAGIYAFLRA